MINEGEMKYVEQFTQAGKSIELMQIEAKKICTFLSCTYGFRVQELVADFVKDSNDIFWLINVKSFLLEESNYLLKFKEHEHLIKNQAAMLESLRVQASDSSNNISK